MTALYNRSPCYAQLYFYDVDTAINYRLSEHFNRACSNNLMREISFELERSNPFVRSFIAMKDHCQRIENQNKEICMLIKVNHDLLFSKPLFDTIFSHKVFFISFFIFSIFFFF